MTVRIKNIVKTNQFILFALFVIVWFIFQLINPNIFSMANIFSLTRASIIPAVFSLALMLIMVMGSFDISFAMIGAFAAYCSNLILTESGLMEVPLIVPFLISVAIAVALQLCNWFFIDKLSLQPFITTLAMQSMLKGAILAFISTSFIYTLPDKLRELSVHYLARAALPDGTESVLHVSVIFVVLLYVFFHLLLRYTSFGRKMYAIGADVVAARRAGINVSRIRFITFALAGVICGIGGILHDALVRSSVPTPLDLVGQELTFIAAVILGCGTSKQARGSVVGTFIAVLFLRFVTTNLIMLGIPSYWQKIVIGIIIFIGLIAQIAKRRKYVQGKE